MLCWLLLQKPAPDHQDGAAPVGGGAVAVLQHHAAAVLHSHGRVQRAPGLRVQHVRRGAGVLAAGRAHRGPHLHVQQAAHARHRAVRARVWRAVRVGVQPGLPARGAGRAAAQHRVCHGHRVARAADLDERAARQLGRDEPDHVHAQRDGQRHPHLHHHGAHSRPAQPGRRLHPGLPQQRAAVAGVEDAAAAAQGGDCGSSCGRCHDCGRRSCCFRGSRVGRTRGKCACSTNGMSPCGQHLCIIFWTENCLHLFCTCCCGVWLSAVVGLGASCALWQVIFAGCAVECLSRQDVRWEGS
mmetsp:Transcript_4132/g.10348  ORF Transcript_4132/g.10348 Transcript_4132/m.10348 type:complete len:298 (+) Transcript_4132:504-1397(+)